MVTGRGILVPNGVAGVRKILSKNTEGFNGDMYRKEKVRVGNGLGREAGELVFSLFEKKGKMRGTITKRY